MAIVLSDAPVRAEEKSPALHPSRHTSSALTSFNSDSSSKNHAIASSNGAISDKALHHASPQGRTAGSKQSADAGPPPKQAASLSTEFSLDTDKSTNSALPPAPVAQADTPPAPPESEDDSASGDRWQFSVEPYFFVPLAVQGDVTVAGRSASINLGLDDVLELDHAFDAGLRLEAQHDRLGFILDAFYVSAAQSGTVGVTLPEGSLLRFGIPTAARVDGDASLSVDELTVDAAVSYRVVDTVLGNSTAATPYPRLVVAPILGLRTQFLWEALAVDTVRIGDISLPIDRDFHSSRTTVSPLLGTRIDLDLSKRWAINMRGDVSGFNINADQDFTWNLLIGTQYHLSPHFSLQLAYRFNGFDFEDGEGLRRTRLNLYQNGLWLSGIFRF